MKNENVKPNEERRVKIELEKARLKESRVALRERQKTTRRGLVERQEVKRKELSKRQGIKQSRMMEDAPPSEIQEPEEETGGAPTQSQEEVSPGGEEDFQQELAQAQAQAKETQAEDAQSKKRKEQEEKAEKLQAEINENKKKIVMLFLCPLPLALAKDILDALGEAFTGGIWSLLDWILDILIGITFFLLRVEKDPKEQLLGWGYVLLEIIPYVGMLPLYTARVARAILKRFNAILENNKKLEKVQKELEKLKSQ